LKQTNGKVFGPRGAAELLGMKPSTLASRISSLGISRRTLD
jgi:transcriptional regulator with GAF, ATPase, and Fis domain